MVIELTSLRLGFGNDSLDVSSILDCTFRSTVVKALDRLFELFKLLGVSIDFGLSFTLRLERAVIDLFRLILEDDLVFIITLCSVSLVEVVGVSSSGFRALTGRQ